LLLIYYLFFTLESSPMHSYVYIPLSDKEYPIASRIPIFMYDSFESCIAACSSYSTGELLCNAFMYSDITKACHLHFYALHLAAGMCPVETGQSQFYLHHGCLNRSSTLLNAGVNKKNETDDKIIVLPDLHKSCLIRKRHVSESFFAKITAYVTATSLKKCLSRCIVKGAEACNSVIFSLQEKSCTLVTHQSTFSALSETVQSSAYFFEIHHCKTKVIKNPLLMQILSQNPTILTQFISGYSIQHTPITESENATIIDLLECTTMQCCLQCCILKRVALGCNAIFFNAKEKTCLLMKLNVNSSNTAELVLYNLYAEVVKNPLLMQILSQNLTIPTQSISGYIIQHIPITESENATIIDLLKCTTMQCCLQCCILKRVDLGCNAIFFNAKEKTCLLMKLNVNSSNTAELVLYNLYADTDGKEKLILSNYEDTLRFKTSFVSLHEFHERCQITTFTSAYAENLKVHPLMLQTNTLNGCLNVCRSNRSDIFNCLGVLFSKHEEICYQLVKGTSHDQIVTLDGQTIVLLQRCVKDREEDRKNNIVFFHYYFHELEEKCVFEFYDSKNFSGFELANCSWISVYVPKLDATCVLLAKKINNFEAYYIEQLFCSFESCVAICFQHQYPCNSIKYTRFAKQCELYIRNATYHSLPEDDETGQSRHFLLHSCHKEIAAVSVGKLIHTPSMDADTTTANIHLPSIHRMCVVQKRPFVESYGIQRLQQITTSSLRLCLAACEAPTYSSCNSVLFSAQEETCILLARPQAFRFLGGTSATVETAAQYFINLFCRNDISSVPVKKIIHTTLLNVAGIIADVHLPSIHKVYRVQRRPFVESYRIQRLLLITASSLKRCLAACDVHSHTSCNSVLFSVQEKTCILLKRRPGSFRLQGSSPTFEADAQYFIVLFRYDDFTRSEFYDIPSSGRPPVIAYAASHLDMQIAIHHEVFYASRTAVRLHLRDSADEKECLNICIASIITYGCDAYYFSSRENTCLTMRLKRRYASAIRRGYRSITKFYDDETLNITLRDPNETRLKYPDHFIELEVSLHEFKEICVTQHWISTLIPNIIFNKHYANISFFNECIHICRHLKNSEECNGIAYSKQMKTCMIAVDGNKNGEILLSNDQQYVTLSSCKKDRETERANNTRHVFCFIPELDEMCLLELYEPLSLSGWKIITSIENTFSLQECLSKCASVMNAQKCSAVNFIDQQCSLLGRANQTNFTRSVYSVFAELLYCE
ncbi:hypothetical protein T01_5647, partial [Trichinella spiralis]